MSAAVDVKLLKSVEAVIAEHGIHQGPWDEPVSLVPLLEPFTVTYADLPRPVQAITTRWKAAGTPFVDISYNRRLSKLSASALKREVDGHEFGHIHLKHDGSQFVMLYKGERDLFNLYLDNIQERQCQVVAAHLLVRLDTIFHLSGMETSYIARVVDVPPRLVEVRWVIWRKFRR